MMARASFGLTLAAAALVVLLGASPALAQSVADNAPPRAAPTTPVWTVAPDANPQSSSPQPTATPPRYAVMADTPPPAAPPAPAAPAERGRYSVSNPPPDLRLNTPEAARAVRAGRDAAYVLGAGDKLRVTVYGEPDLSGEFEVDGTGNVRMPLIGQVQAGGLTVHAFESRVTEQLAGRYLLHPQVSAEVTAYRPFFIIGEVNKPGQYPYVADMNVVTAVALAGGYTYRADEDDVYVRRNGSNTEVEQPADATTSIHPGDVIRVTERFF